LILIKFSFELFIEINSMLFLFYFSYWLWSSSLFIEIKEKARPGSRAFFRHAPSPITRFQPIRKQEKIFSQRKKEIFLLFINGIMIFILFLWIYFSNEQLDSKSFSIFKWQFISMDSRRIKFFSSGTFLLFVFMNLLFKRSSCNYLFSFKIKNLSD